MRKNTRKFQEKSRNNPFGFQAPFLPESKEVQERFDPSSALSVMSHLWNRSYARRKLWASIDMEVNCEPPYDEKELEEKGRGYQSNFSSRVLEGDVNQAVSRYIALLNSQENQAILPIKLDAQLPEGWGASDVQTVLQSIFNEAVQLWHDKKHTDACSIYDIVKYGQCLYMNMGMLDWRDKRVPLTNVLISDRASSIESQWHMIGIIDYLPIDQLVAIVKDDHASMKQGWNPAGIAHMLLEYAVPQWQNKVFTWDSVLEHVQALRVNGISGDTDELFDNFEIPVVKVFVKEYEKSSPEAYNHKTGTYDTFPGKEENQISLYIIPYSAASRSKNDSLATIYRKRFAYKGFEDVFTAAQFMPHEYFWGSRGLGQMTLNFAVADSMLQSGAMDAALASLEMRFIPQSNDDYETLENVKDANILPPGTQILETSNFAKNIIVAQNFSTTLQQRKVLNLQQPANKAPGAISPYETATAAQLRVAQESNNLSHQELRFWLDQDRRVRRQVKNLVRLLAMKNDSHYLSEEIGCKPIIEHIQMRLKTMGLPQNAFDFVNTDLVTAGKTFGRGTLQEQIMSFNMMREYLPILPPNAQDEIMRGMLTTLFGADQALRWLPPRKSITRTEQQQIWEANQENSVLESGMMPYIRPDDIDIIHIAQHNTLLQNLRERLQSSAADPIRILDALLAVQLHIYGDGGHAARYLMRVNAETLNGREIIATLSEGANQLQQLIASTEQAAQERLSAGQLDPVQQVRLAELQSRMQSRQLNDQIKIANQARAERNDMINQQYMQTQMAKMQSDMLK